MRLGAVRMGAVRMMSANRGPVAVLLRVGYLGISCAMSISYPRGRRHLAVPNVESSPLGLRDTYPIVS